LIAIKVTKKTGKAAGRAFGEEAYLAPISMKYRLLCMLLLLLPSLAMAQHASTDSLPTGGLRINKIIITGNKVTRQAVILRELCIKEGDTLYADKLQPVIDENRLRLMNLQLFNDVFQYYEQVDGGVEWHIKVSERWYYIPTGIVQFADRDLNAWWVKQNHDLRRVTAGVTLTDINFRGNLEQLAVTVQGGYTQKLGVSYMRPYVNKDQTHGIGVVANVAQSRETYYNTISDKLVFAGAYTGDVIWRAADVGIRYVYRPAYATRHFFQLSYAFVQVGDTVVRLNRDYFTQGSNTAKYMELLYRFEYNRVDNWSYPLVGFKLVNYAVMRQGFEGVHFQGFIHEEAGYFVHPLRKWYASLILRGRLMIPDEQPYYFRGGPAMQRDQLRGYEYYVLDGYQYGVLRGDVKREIFRRAYATDIKYLSVVPLRVYLKVFADVGYINNDVPAMNRLPNTTLASAGIGMDIVTAYDVKMRLEFARNALGQNGIYLHFNSE
jgi:outer membrane protein assembly factor BamA